LKTFAERPLNTPASGIREIVNKAVHIKDAIRLEVGQPDFETPRHIVEATHQAMLEGHTRYTQTSGYHSLRDLLAQKVGRVNGIRAELNQVNVTVGASGGIASTLAVLCDEGDEVLVPDPYFPNYLIALSCTPAKPVFYPLHARNQFLPDLGEIEALITPRTKLILVNSPCNPSGKVFPREILEGLVQLCQKYDLYYLSDECYDQIVFDAAHVSPASFCDDKRIISIFSFSKTYAMTGFRVGYVISDPELCKVINKILEGNTACVTSFAQKGAEAALTGPQEIVGQMVAAYHQRRDIVMELLDGFGIPYVKPEGAFYILADISASGLDARSFALQLLDQTKVAVSPGTAFGKVCKDFVRISLASSENDLREGVARMNGFLRSLYLSQSW
jgi:aspartate aminotransferase